MTAVTSDNVTHTSTAAAKRSIGLDRVAGVGGLVFVGLLIAQNALRAKGPSFGAAPAAVSAYFVDHRTVAIIPLGMFPIGMVGIVCFVAGIWTNARDDAGRWWANAGALGAIAIAALFAVVNIIEIALTATAHQLANTPDVVRALWAIHAGAFGLDLGAIAVALVGLSRAALTAGLIPGWTAAISLPGAACLLVASMFTVAIADGGPWIALALIGFVVWAIFVVVASISLMRRSGNALRTP